MTLGNNEACQEDGKTQLFFSTDTLVQFKAGIDALGKVHKRFHPCNLPEVSPLPPVFLEMGYASKLWIHSVKEPKDWDTDSFQSTARTRQLPLWQLLAWITKCPLGSY